MYPILGAMAVGALLMGRTKPKTACVKKVVLGPRSGLTYQIEEFPAAGFVVARAPDGSTGVFRRGGPSPPGGAPVAPSETSAFAYSHGRGHPQTMVKMMADFGVSLPNAPPGDPA